MWVWRWLMLCVLFFCVSAIISTLSSCMLAVVALLYPFSWQHTFIPVLPGSMLDIVCCPTPFLVGLLSSSLPKLKELPVEEVSLLSLDSLWSPSCSFFPKLYCLLDHMDITDCSICVSFLLCLSEVCFFGLVGISALADKLKLYTFRVIPLWIWSAPTVSVKPPLPLVLWY